MHREGKGDSGHAPDVWCHLLRHLLARFCISTIIMTIERWLRLIAGALITASVLLGVYVNAHFFWLTGFVGLNLLQSGFTNWCPMMSILRGVCVRG